MDLQDRPRVGTDVIVWCNDGLEYVARRVEPRTLSDSCSPAHFVVLHTMFHSDEKKWEWLPTESLVAWAPLPRLEERQPFHIKFNDNELKQIERINPTPQQRTSFTNLCKRYGKFPRTLDKNSLLDDALVCDFGFIVVVIEKDGYTHS